MKNLISRLMIAAIIVVTASACGTSGYITGNDGDYYNSYRNSHVSYDMFYNQLSPYGNWINYPGYGRVWIAHEPGFRPYHTNGRWMHTNYGWTWVSNYNWGWAPFHYGRWGHDPRFGWFWVPGLEWAPAWVTWRGNGSYYGWAPMMPHNWRYQHRYDPWTFVNGRHINQQNLAQYTLSPDRNDQLLTNTTVVRPERAGLNYNPGPERTEVEKQVGAPIRTLKVSDAENMEKNAVSDNEIRLYRPGKEEIIKTTPGRTLNQGSESNNPSQPGRIYRAEEVPAEGNRPERKPLNTRTERQPEPQRQMERPQPTPRQPTPAMEQPRPARSNFPAERPMRTMEPQRPARSNFPAEQPVRNERRMDIQHAPQPMQRPAQRVEMPARTLQPAQATLPARRPGGLILE